MTRPDHAAIVLAAGGSTRLGTPKQLLTRGGEPLVRRALRLALATRPVRTIVITGACSGEVAAAIDGLACERLEHAGWRDGLGSSLAFAAAALASHAGSTLIVLCDQPGLDEAHLEALLDRAAHARSGCAATQSGGALGAPAVVTRSVLAEALALEWDRGLGAVLRALPREAIACVDAPALAFDLDTPGDLDEARRRGWLDAE